MIALVTLNRHKNGDYELLGEPFELSSLILELTEMRFGDRVKNKDISSCERRRYSNIFVLCLFNGINVEFA